METLEGTMSSTEELPYRRGAIPPNSSRFQENFRNLSFLRTSYW